MSFLLARNIRDARSDATLVWWPLKILSHEIQVSVVPVAHPSIWPRFNRCSGHLNHVRVHAPKNIGGEATEEPGPLYQQLVPMQHACRRTQIIIVAVETGKQQQESPQEPCTPRLSLSVSIYPYMAANGVCLLVTRPCRWISSHSMLSSFLASQYIL
jgi:hypothetical protein